MKLLRQTFEKALTLSGKFTALNEGAIKGHLKELAQGSVEETLNELPELKAEKLTAAGVLYGREKHWAGIFTRRKAVTSCREPYRAHSWQATKWPGATSVICWGSLHLALA